MECQECNKEFSGHYNRKYCKICAKTRQKQQTEQWKKNNKKHIKEYSKKYYKINKNECNNRFKLWREKNKEYCKKYDKQYYENNKEKCLNHYKKWKKDNPKKIKEYDKNRRKRFPKVVKAHGIINRKIKRNEIYKPSTLKCIKCDNQAEQYHHSDYNKPLKVIPVCVLCHRKIHKK